MSRIIFAVTPQLAAKILVSTPGLQLDAVLISAHSMLSAWSLSPRRGSTTATIARADGCRSTMRSVSINVSRGQTSGDQKIGTGTYQEISVAGASSILDFKTAFRLRLLKI